MDCGALILQPPTALLLPEAVSLAARPVDLVLIGSRFDQPLEPFWELIYHHCRVPGAHVFPMRSMVDLLELRPYFNAGLLAVRPPEGLLQAWWDDFLQLYRLPEFEPFYQLNPRYRLFMHQAVLAGSLLQRLSPTHYLELPAAVNYPLHFHTRYPVEHRPATLDELVTCRYETLFDQPGWWDKIPPASPLLLDWLEAHLSL
jgi:hypothetical protein